MGLLTQPRALIRKLAQAAFFQKSRASSIAESSWAFFFREAAGLLYHQHPAPESGMPLRKQHQRIQARRQPPHHHPAPYGR